MAGRNALPVEAEDIVRAAIAIFEEQGLDAVSMRSVSARLGVSPVPIYSRIGNKVTLLDAMADQLIVDAVPPAEPWESWDGYAMRWATGLRDRLVGAPDIRLLLGNRRSPYVEASRPLVDVLRGAGFATDWAVQTCRLLLWATIGFSVVEMHHDRGGAGQPVGGGRLPGGDPSGVSAQEADQLFSLHIGYLLRGVAQGSPEGGVVAKSTSVVVGVAGERSAGRPLEARPLVGRSRSRDRAAHHGAGSGRRTLQCDVRHRPGRE